jgi:hypothetical protein
MNSHDIANKIVREHGLDPTLVIMIIRVIFYLYEIWKDCDFKPLKDRECRINTRLIVRRVFGRVLYKECGELVIQELLALREQYNESEFRTMCRDEKHS